MVNNIALVSEQYSVTQGRRFILLSVAGVAGLLRHGQQTNQREQQHRNNVSHRSLLERCGGALGRVGKRGAPAGQALP